MRSPAARALSMTGRPSHAPRTGRSSFDLAQGPEPASASRRRTIADVHAWPRAATHRRPSPSRPPASSTGPRLTIDVEAMTGKDLRLAIQRRTPGELRRRNPGDEGCRGHAALDQTWARLGLNHRALAGPARVFGTDEPKNPQDRGNLIEHLADILADAMERAGAARTRCRLRLDRHVAARKMLGQGPDIAVPLVPRSRSGLGLVVVVGGRRQGGVRLGIAQT